MKIILTGEYTEGDSIQIYTDNIIKYYSKKKIIDKRIKIHKLTNSKIPLQKRIHSIIKNILLIIKEINKLKKREDIKIIISQTHYFLYKFLKSDIIIIHDLFYLDYYKKEKNIVKKIIYYLLFNIGHIFFLKRHKHIVTISNKTKEELLKRGIPGKKITIIYNGVDHNIFQNNTEIKKKDQILCVGMEYPRKNLEGSILAFMDIKKIYPHYTLVKLGGFEDSNDRKKLEIFITKKTDLQIGKDIVFKNMVSKKELIQHYKESRLLLFPSFEEGFGFPIIEAQACGCPVITSNIPPMNELVPYKKLLVNPFDTKDIIKKTTILLETNYEEYIQKGIKFSQNFNWENSTKELVNLLYQ